MKNLRILVGSYTDSENLGGLTIVDFDSKTYKYEEFSSVDAVNTSYCHIKNGILFVVNESDTDEDTISSYDISDVSNLKFIDKIQSFGSAPCYISSNKGMDHVFTANYNGGTVSVTSIDRKGRFIHTDQVVKDIANIGLKSHMHAAVLSPNEKFLIVCNLGLDTVTIYPYDSGTKEQPLDLDKAFVFQLDSGIGPRHLVFSNDGNYLYVVGELNGTVQVFKWCETGKIEHLQSQGLMPSDYRESNSAADIHFTPDGNFLFVSNRGDANQLIKFTVDKGSGLLSLLKRYSTLGVGPRNFCIDPSGKFIIIAHQHTNDVSIFLSDDIEGKDSLQLLTKIAIHKPVFVNVL